MELVILVDEQNNDIGTAWKDTVHTKTTPLHRAFSLFLFNNINEVLLTHRSKMKKAFPDVWTNTVCGHPAPGETTTDAAKRRLLQELGISGVEIWEVSPYRYRFTDQNGIVENEICPILLGRFNGDPKPDPNEVDNWKWMDWRTFLDDMRANPHTYSPWCKEEVVILQQKNPELQ